jgi:hypothetical protein
MLIMQRKFDFRVWVVIDSWNPLRVYMYEEWYVRFGSQNYCPDFTNQFAHLTNNSIQKQNKNQNNKIVGNMWSLE